MGTGSKPLQFKFASPRTLPNGDGKYFPTCHLKRRAVVQFLRSTSLLNTILCGEHFIYILSDLGNLSFFQSFFYFLYAGEK